MRIAHILRHYVAWLAFDLLLLANNFDTASTRRCTRLHNVHVSIIFSFSIHAELSIVVREKICLWAEIKLLENTLHSANVLPHHVFSTNLERLREMVHFLIFCSLFEMLRLDLSCPHNVPFWTIRANYTETCCLQSVDYRVINVSCLTNLESKHHLMLLEVLLAGYLNLLKLTELGLGCPVACLQECQCCLLHIRRGVFVIWIWLFI